MRHPFKYTRAINYTYIFTVGTVLSLWGTLLITGQYLLDALITVAGFLMFGQEVHDEVTSNIIMSKGYPHAISVCLVVFIAIIPLTKIPLK